MVGKTRATKPKAHADKLHAGKKSTKKSRASAAPDIEIKASKDGSSNVLYIGHLPHGFFEKQMREFFSQFGTVINVRLSRSKKSAKSKGYAFLQFQSVEVASIAAEAMNGYHMFGQKLVVKTLKKADVHPQIFNGANRVFKRIPWREIEAKRHNKERTEEEEKKRAARGRRAAKKRLERIAASGIDYVFDPDAAEEKNLAKKTTKRTVAEKKEKTAKKASAKARRVESKAPTKTVQAKTPTAKAAKGKSTRPASEKKVTPAMTRSRTAKKKSSM